MEKYGKYGKYGKYMEKYMEKYGKSMDIYGKSMEIYGKYRIIIRKNVVHHDKIIQFDWKCVCLKSSRIEMRNVKATNG